MSLRLRILGVLAVLLALNVLFVLTVLWAYLVFLPTLAVSVVFLFDQGVVVLDVLRLPVSLPTLTVVVAAVLGAQLYYGYQRVLAGTQPVSGESDHEIATLLEKLAAQADVPVPNLRVVADDEVSCYTVGRFRNATIVLTTGLVEQLDTEELAAVLAHELSHIANRDVTLMTITTLFLEIATRTYGTARLVRRAVTDPGTLSERDWLVLRFFLPLAVLTYVFVVPLLWAYPRIADWATRELSHTREFAADAGAAQLTGNPLALATALSKLAETADPPERDMREARTQALCILPMSAVSGSPTEGIPAVSTPTNTNRDAVLDAWRKRRTPDQSTDTATHPSVAARIDRLRELARDLS